MTPIFALRLALDGLAAVLMVAALAYWWLGNLAHEAIGAALFGLIGLHVWFNRRWYAGLLGGGHDLRRSVVAAVHLAFLAVMAVVLATSLLLARDLFAVPGLAAGFRAREIHLFASYWAVALMGVHLGLNWRRVLGALGLRDPDPVCRWGMRVLIAGVALKGAAASAEMAFGTKLALGYALDMWDFEAETPRFFANYAAIIGLYAAAGHYARITLLSRTR